MCMYVGMYVCMYVCMCVCTCASLVFELFDGFYFTYLHFKIPPPQSPFFAVEYQNSSPKNKISSSQESTKSLFQVS
jgi:hypothetical protein